MARFATSITYRLLIYILPWKKAVHDGWWRVTTWWLASGKEPQRAIRDG